MFHHLPDWQIDNGFSKKTNHGTYSNLGTQVGACNKDFSAVSQMGLTRVLFCLWCRLMFHCTLQENAPGPYLYTQNLKNI